MPKLLLYLLCCLFICVSGLARTPNEACIKAIRQGDYYLGRFKAEESLERFNQAIVIADQMQHDSLKALALFGAGQAIWYNGNFQHAADTIKIAIAGFRKVNDLYNLTGALRVISNVYDDQGEYEKAFKAVVTALDIFETFNDDQNKILSLTQMGALYKNIGDYEAALGFYRKAWNEQPRKGDYSYRELSHRTGELYAETGLRDSAEIYYKQAFTGNPASKVIRVKMAELYLDEKNYDKAFELLDGVYKEAKSNADLNTLIATLVGMGKVYVGKNNHTEALKMAMSGYDLATQRGLSQFRREASLLLSEIMESQGNTAGALEYRKRFDSINNAVISSRFKGQLYAFKQKTEQSTQAAKVQSLLNEKRIAYYSILIICLLGILAFCVVFFRHKNEKLRFKQTASELEMKALRAQMDPHFIFNCLSAINHFILNNEGDRASEYLTRFSRLIRLVLNNVGKPVITLEEELETLVLYLNMEQLRFKDAFEYYIYFDPGVEASEVMIPSFILQPFCENAIWHGLLHKESKGQLNIHFRLVDDLLICNIKDNGIGRERALEYRKQSTIKQQSLGNKLTAERLDLFNGENGPGSFKIGDTKDEDGSVTGTEVEVKIKIRVL